MFELKIPTVGENIKHGVVVKINVRVGDKVKKDQAILELETDKASLEVPSPVDGVIQEILIREGQEVKIGQTVMRLETGAAAAKTVSQPAASAVMASSTATPTSTSQPTSTQPAAAVSSTLIDFALPAVGENVKTGTIVKIHVNAGDTIRKNQTLLELETDKATLDVPSPVDGIIKAILVKNNQQVKIGQVVMQIQATSVADTKTVSHVAAPAQAPTTATSTKTPTPSAAHASTSTILPNALIPPQKEVPAAPSVRRLARELGLIVSQVSGTGPGGRISIDDVKAHAKKIITSGGGGSGIPTRALPDFTKWGSAERQAMNNIRKKTAEHLSYCWSTIPHVTQFDKADLTELEKVRKQHSTPERNLTVTPFLMKVIAQALKTFPQFNASVDMTTNEIIYKKYFNLGIAVDTDRGLLVPVVKNVDQKSVVQLADELKEMAERARNKKTSLDELQGGSMTITNLGGIGGQFFTPIVNWPEVAILGVSRAAYEPVWDGTQFISRFRLPLSLSYDHRLIDGADGARFIRFVVEQIEKAHLMDINKA
jgi:pyruvate dehydrogenase E2 component (dihydrolipoamide acetyltransferase)